MNLSDLDPTPPTIDPTPRPYPRGARRRAVEAGEKPAFELRGTHMLAIALSGLFLAGLIILGWSFSASKPVQAPIQPTAEGAPTPEARLFVAPPTTRPAAPQATIAPTPEPAPTPPAVVAPGASQDAPPIGQGLTLVEDAPAPAADTYLANVAAQAPHSPRGDGQAGPAGGNWVAVPTITSAQADVITQQAPHAVR